LIDFINIGVIYINIGVICTDIGVIYKLRKCMLFSSLMQIFLQEK